MPQMLHIFELHFQDRREGRCPVSPGITVEQYMPVNQKLNVVMFAEYISKTPFTRYNRLSYRFDNRLYRVNGV